MMVRVVSIQVSIRPSALTRLMQQYTRDIRPPLNAILASAEGGSAPLFLVSSSDHRDTETVDRRGHYDIWYRGPTVDIRLVHPQIVTSERYCHFPAVPIPFSPLGRQESKQIFCQRPTTNNAPQTCQVVQKAQEIRSSLDNNDSSYSIVIAAKTKQPLHYFLGSEIYEYRMH